jgi:hypothetical protein
VTLATGASAIVASAVGLVGLPVASRPAVVGAAVRLSTCVADGDGPEVPPYEAMPAQFSNLEAKAATSGLATATNTVFVLVCIAGAYAVAQVPFDAGSGGGGLSMSASLAHVAATVPLSYIGPAVAEFSASWMTAAAAGTAGSSALGYWWVSFLGGLGTVWAAWALMLWRARIVTVASPSADQRLHDAPGGGGRAPILHPQNPWSPLLRPLLEATRDVTASRIRYAFFVELGCGLLFSALSGIRVESLCVPKCIAATLVALAFLGYLLIVQPAAERRDHWFGVGFAALQALTGAIVTAAVLGDRTNASWTSEALDAAQIVSLVTLLMVQALVGLVVALCAKHRGVRRDLASDALGAPLLAVPKVDDGSTVAAAAPGSPSVRDTHVHVHDWTAVANPLQRLIHRPAG